VTRIWLRPASLAALAAGALAAMLPLFPFAVLEASLRGLSIWWEVLFPSLFPFFVISELLIGFGIVHFLGMLLDPVMRPLFRLPGSAGFVVAMGYISGYPVSARLTARLREQELISRAEGERIVAFTTTSDPIFLIGAVSVGFFQQPAIAPLLAAAHYGGSLLVGLAMRLHDRRGPVTPAVRRNGSGRGGRLAAALNAMHEARLADGRDIGRLLQDAVRSALRLMMVVGGLVVFFAVVMEVLARAGVMGLLQTALGTVLAAAGLPAGFTAPFAAGLFEVTLGARSAAGGGAGLIHQAAAAAWVLSWAGLSVHAQVASLLSRSGLRYWPFLAARGLHGLFAFLLVYLLWGWLGPVR